MRSARGILALLFVTVLLGACASEPRIRAHIEAFSTLARTPVAQTVSVAPLGGLSDTSLEFRTYADRLEAPLARRGFRVVDEAAAWELAMGYGIDDGREVVETFTIPDYGYGWGARRRFPYYDPFFPGYRTEVIARTLYTRHLVLALADTSTGAEAWRVRVVSTGGCPTLGPVFDALVAAAFDGFPEAGTRTLDVAIDERC